MQGFLLGHRIILIRVLLAAALVFMLLSANKRYGLTAHADDDKSRELMKVSFMRMKALRLIPLLMILPQEQKL